MANINDVLDGHVALEVECVDRLYLNAYVPNLQVGGQVVRFLTEHLGNPIPSPALFEKIGNRFRREVKAYAQRHGIPILALKKPDRTRWDDRKLDHVGPYLSAAERAGRFGVVAIVSAQEFQWVFGARDVATQPRAVCYAFDKSERRVGTYYFYVRDAEFGAGFIKICTYFPYPAKVWCNGHEWAKRQADREGIAYTALANGFAACAEPQRLQGICDRFGPADVQGFFDRWIDRIPTPFTAADRAGGYWWELSMRQVELSRTLVFDDPRRARSFFESLVADNVGIGRPEQVSLVFERRVHTEHQGHLPHPGVRAGHRGGHGLPLQAQPGQAVLEGREGAENRDRHQQAPGHRGPLPARAHGRAGGQGPRGQPSSARDRTCRPGLCHRLCAL
ncbi:MAG: hypothetical protein ACRD1D_01280 [Acidimicrobiales bacterium]